MDQIYLKFYEENKRAILEDELPGITDMTYLKYRKDGFYELKNNVYVGRVDKKNQFAFLLQDPTDIFLNPDLAINLMDQDIIMIQVIKDKPRIIKILKRGLEYIIVEAKIRKKGFKYYTEKPLRKNILVDDESKILDGSILKLKVEKIVGDRVYTTLDSIVGHITDPNIDILKIVASHNWPNSDFNLLEDEANNLNINIEDESKYRLNLTNDLIVTIDGADAKDLDDAISLVKKDNIYHLGVHIADVSLYVKRGSLIDKNAYLKATSVYLANSVIPMLPRKLANDLCSLNPHTNKLTLSVLMDIDEFGKVLNYRLEKTVINSKYRLTYDAVNDLLNNGKSLGNKELDNMINQMNDLSNVLNKLRIKRGSLNFKADELKFLIENDEVIDVELRKQDLGEQLIESFMLLANETVAFHMETNHFPSIYRIHEKPETAKLETTFNILSSLGLKISKTYTPKNIQNILKQVENKPIEDIVNMFLLRSMQKAKYDHNSLGHFGLGARYYTHFTSPIRRYPDLILHRIIRELVFAENNNLKNYHYYENHLEEISKHTSKMERVAIDIEREVNSLMTVKYMANKIGDIFEGQIIQVLKTGFFVKLLNGVEGFVNVKNQYYKYEYNELLLSYKIKGETYQIGDKIKVELIDVNLIEKEIDFKIVVGV